MMKKYYYVNVFFAGMMTIATEFVASRSLQNIYGASNFVWATIIGSIMIYFALGYYYGGKFADRIDGIERLFSVQALASGLLLFIPLISNLFLTRAALAFDLLNFPVMAGAFVGVIVLYSVPVILLAMTMPVMIKFIHEDEPLLGKVTGNVNAVSTLGSVVGAFVPTLWMFGSVGTSKTMRIIALIMLLIAIIGIWLKTKRFKLLWHYVVLFGVGIIMLFIDLPIKNTPGQVFESESAYNYIEVIQNGTTTYLRLNEGQGFHSQYDNQTNFYKGPWEVFLLGPMFIEDFSKAKVNDILVVGMAAGTTISQAANVYPMANLTGIEIDPKIVEVGQTYFDLDPGSARIMIGDGRYELRHVEGLQDLIIVDAYVPPYIPAHMVTKEFFEECGAILKEDGVITVNVGRTVTDRELINDIASTLSTSFEYTIFADLPYTFNTVIFASNQPLTIENFVDAYLGLDKQDEHDRLLIQTGQFVFSDLKTSFEPGTIYTDDISPIEKVTNRMIFDFILME